jgi:Phosphotransferase enzyme family
VSESPALPFGLQGWYPALAGPLRVASVLGQESAWEPAALRAAWHAAAPGSALVLVDRAQGPRQRLKRALRPGRAARALARLNGAERSDRWLVLPGTGGSHALLPAARAGFVGGLSLLPQGRARWRAVREVLRKGASFAPFIGLDELHVLVKGGHGKPVPPAAPGADAAHAAIALGVPGLFRKAIVRLLEEDGRPLGVLKLPLTERARDRIAHEGAVLRDLDTLAPPGTFGPRLLDDAGSDWLLLEDLVGERSPDALETPHLGWLAGLHVSSACQRPLGKGALFSAAEQRLNELRARSDKDWMQAFTGLANALRSRADRTIECCLAHGDFTPWNLMLCGGRLRALDWESAAEDLPALHDVAHFHLQTGILVRHQTAEDLLEQFDGLCAGFLAPYLQQVGIHPSQSTLYLALYLLHQATLDEEQNLIERPPFAQVEWLRRARLELALSLTARLNRKRRRSAA